MASAKASNPQTWNRYSYALNNPLRFVDPAGLDVPESCAESEDFKIKIKLNVVYNSKANGGKGLTKEQKKEFEKEQVEKAKKDFGVIPQLHGACAGGGPSIFPNYSLNKT